MGSGSDIINTTFFEILLFKFITETARRESGTLKYEGIIKLWMSQPNQTREN